MTTETRKLAAILAADVVGFSRLAGADEEGTLARLRALRGDLIDPTVAAHKGRVVKRTGDGAIVEFRSVVDAVRCAIDVQNAMVERNSGVPQESRIEFRIGVHLGDVVEEDDGDLMGEGVNIAARLEGVARPGGICLSDDPYRQVKARLDLDVRDLGPTALKNIAEPMRVYAVAAGKPGARPKPRAAPRAGLSNRVLQAPCAPRTRAPGPQRSIPGHRGFLGHMSGGPRSGRGGKSRDAQSLRPRSVGVVGQFVAFPGHWDEGVATAEKALKLAGPTAVPVWWWPAAKRAWFRGEYQEAYEDFQRAYIESFWLSHLDLAYTLPFLGRIDEAKQHVAALLKMYPTMTIREADAFYKLVCFDSAYREKMAGALRQAGLPE